MPQFYDPETLKILQGLELEILGDVSRLCRENNLTYFGFCGTGIGAIRHKGFIPWDDDIDISMPRKDYEKLIKLIKKEFPDKYNILSCYTDINYPLATTRLCLKGTKFREFCMKDLKCDWGIFIDLYPLDNAADNNIAFYWQMWTSWLWGKLLILRSVPRPYLYVHGIVAKIATGCCIAGHHILKFFHISKESLFKKREKALRKYENVETKRMCFFCDPLPYKNTFDKSKTFPLRDFEFEGDTLPFPNNVEELLTKMFGDYMTPPPVERRKTHFPYELDFGPYDPKIRKD